MKYLYVIIYIFFIINTDEFHKNKKPLTWIHRQHIFFRPLLKHFKCVSLWGIAEVQGIHLPHEQKAHIGEISTSIQYLSSANRNDLVGPGGTFLCCSVAQYNDLHQKLSNLISDLIRTSAKPSLMMALLTSYQISKVVKVLYYTVPTDTTMHNIHKDMSESWAQIILILKILQSSLYNNAWMIM